MVKFKNLCFVTSSIFDVQVLEMFYFCDQYGNLEKNKSLYLYSKFRFPSFHQHSFQNHLHNK